MQQESLLWLTAEDRIYFLDPDKGRYYAIQGKAALDWAASHGQERTAVLAYRAPRGVASPGQAKTGALSMARMAWHAILLARRGVRDAAFGRLYRNAIQLSLRVASPARMDVARAISVFLRVEALFGTKDPSRDCVVRSFSLFFYLSDLGFRPAHVIGVKVLPFVAHAWVEVDGEPLLQRREAICEWRCISRIEH